MKNLVFVFALIVFIGCKKEEIFEETALVAEIPKLEVPKGLYPDHSAEMPPVLDQGKLGACTSFAVSYLKSWQESKEMHWDITKHQYSPAFVYNQVYFLEKERFSVGSTTNDGITIPDALEFLCQNGQSTLDKFSYDQNDYKRQPNLELQYKALQFKAKSWRVSYELDSAKVWLEKSPIISQTKEHAICVVSYNDTIVIDGKKGAFKYLNSYGINKGDKGYSWASYQDTYHYFFLEDQKNVMPELALILGSNIARVFENSENENGYIINPKVKCIFLDKDNKVIKELEQNIVTNNFVISTSDVSEASSVILKASRVVAKLGSNPNMIDIFSVKNMKNEKDFTIAIINSNDSVTSPSNSKWHYQSASYKISLK